MRIKLITLLVLIPCFVFAEGQYGMEEWINKMILQSFIFYTVTVGLFLTMLFKVIRKNISTRQILTFFGIGLGLSTISLVISIISEIESAFMIPYILLLDLFR